MIATKELKTLADFESLQKGDTIACVFHRDMHDHPDITVNYSDFSNCWMVVVSE